MKCRRTECQCQVEAERQFCSPQCAETQDRYEPCGCAHAACL